MPYKQGVPRFTQECADRAERRNNDHMDMPRNAEWCETTRHPLNASPTELQAIADRCESLAASEQRQGFDRAMRVLADKPLIAAHDENGEDDVWIGLLADSGAYESAALALFPPRTTFNGGRLADGTFMAQVILASGAGAHSRAAQSLSMAWVSALLRALAREMIEQRAKL